MGGAGDGAPGTANMQVRLWMGAVALLGVAVASSFADSRRARRADPDRVGMVDWTTLQMLSLIGAAMIGFYIVVAGD